jgi:hypothetical protein
VLLIERAEGCSGCSGSGSDSGGFRSDGNTSVPLLLVLVPSLVSDLQAPYGGIRKFAVGN